MNPRTCIATRTEKSPEEMIRFVIGPDQQVVPDLKRKLPGRGVWVTATRSDVLLAIRKGLFSRGFKASVKVDESLLEIIEERLKSSLLGLLTMARKAGVLVSGKMKVEESLKGGKTAIVIQAVDASKEGKKKMVSLVNRVSPETYIFELFTSAELDQISGNVNSVHLCLKECNLADQFRHTINKQAKFNETN